jgi:hypothetical protein
MKTLEEQIAELQDRLNKLENNLTERSEEYEQCCEYECGCGCDEPETEIEPELEQVILRRGEVLRQGGVLTEPDEPSLDTVIDAPEPEEAKYTFTESDLIAFATKLTQRALTSVQESLENVDISNDDHVSLELDWNNTIQIELNSEGIKKDIIDEIEDNISLRESDVVDEIESIMNEIRREDPNDDGEIPRFQG